MDAIVNLWISGWLTARALFHWLVPSAYLPTLIIAPALQITFFGVVVDYSGRDTAASVVGLVMLNAGVAGLYGGLMVVSGDRWQSTLEPVLHTRMPAGLRMAGRLIPMTFFGSVTSTVLLLGATAWRMAPWDPDRLAILALLAVAGSIAISALGLLVGTIGLLVRDAFIWGGVLFLTLQVTCGALLPRSELPTAVRWATEFLPLSHSVEAARNAVSEGSFVGQACVAALWELGIGVALMSLATLAVSRFEVMAARTGRLSFV